MRMLTIIRSPPAVLSTVVLVFACATVHSAEPYLQFARGLRAKGFGDTAVLYLEQAASRKDLPAEVQSLLDIELSCSYRAWSEQTDDSQQTAELASKADALLERFIATHPHHPAVADSYLEQGDWSLRRAETALQRASQISDHGIRGNLYSTARQLLVKAKSKFADAASNYQNIVSVLGVETALPPDDSQNQGQSSKDRLKVAETGLVQSTMKLGAVELHLAQTYADSKSSERIASLEKAISHFEWVYRRHPAAEVGMRARLWQAKAASDLGKDEDALELYDDVLTVEADAVGVAGELAAFFGQAALWRLQLIVRHQGHETAQAEGTRWLKAHHSWRGTSSYQGIAFETANALLRRAQNENTKVQEKLRKEAHALLQEVASRPGDYRRTAIQLLEGKAVYDVQSNEVEDAFARGDTALAAARWPDAVAAYEDAVRIAQRSSEKVALAKAESRLNLARFRHAASLYSKGNHAEAIKAAGLVARSGSKDPHAAEAAMLSCYAAFRLYDAAGPSEKTLAEDRLRKIVDFTVKTFHGTSTADDARITIGQFESQLGNWDAALQQFGSVPDASPRFPAAVLTAAKVLRKRSLTEQRKPAAERDESSIRRWREEAEQRLQSVVDRKGADPAADYDGASSDCRVLLAELKIEAGNHLDALEYLKPIINRQPLSEPVRDEKQTNVGAHAVALRASLASRQLELACELAGKLAQFGPDQPSANNPLVEFIRLAQIEVGESTAIDRAQGIIGQVKVEADNRRQLCQDSLKEIVPLVAARSQLGIPSLVVVAESCVALRHTETAQKLCERVLASTDEQDANSTPYRTRAQLLLVELYRDENRFEDALELLEGLEKAKPKTLVLAMKKGELLQAQAKKDPRLWEASMNHWTRLRVQLSQLRPRPKEYYTSIYNAAICLRDGAALTQDPVKSKQAEQLLKAALALEPQLDGPETVRRFQSLLATIRSPQDRAQNSRITKK